VVDASESLVPNPLKPKFRFPKPRERLTTITAVQCRDGVIFCGDSQVTSQYVGLETKQSVSKILPVSYNDKNDVYCLLGCSGEPEYIERFRENIGEQFFKRENKSYFEALDKATQSYSKYFISRRREIGLAFTEDLSPFASAIFVGYEPKDRRTRVFVLSPPKPPAPVSAYPYRAIIGTGELYASFLFSIAELLMGKVGLTWNDLSPMLVAQFCYMVLGRVMSYDSYTGFSTTFYRIDKTGKYENLEGQQIFPGHKTDERYRLSILIKTLLSEQSREVLQLAQEYRVPEAMKLFLASAR
jgi:hypothetical protein